MHTSAGIQCRQTRLSNIDDRELTGANVLKYCHRSTHYVNRMDGLTRFTSFFCRGFCLGMLGFVFLTFPVNATDNFMQMRQRMLQVIASDVAQTSEYTGKSALDERVMQALGTVERHRFVPPMLQSAAYENRPLPIGYGQTISQPYIVALMTDLLEPAADDVVLEVGTGSGYQAAILSSLVSRVYSIEIIPELARSASKRLQKLGFNNVEVRNEDGYHGWQEHAPFDAIIVTAASSHIPPPLVRQLKPGGVLMIPVGPAFQVQQLSMVRKTVDGEIQSRQLMPVRFVPFTGEH